jgi:hypothetical protein
VLDPNIHIHKTEQTIIEEAIKFCTRISSYNELNHEHITLIRIIQSKLINLPFLQDNVDCSITFSIRRGNNKKGLERNWSIMFFSKKNHGVTNGYLEIFNSYNPLPMPFVGPDFLDMVSQESYMCWQVDRTPDNLKSNSGADWIREVNNLHTFFQQEDSAFIEIAHDHQFHEINCTSSFMKS